MINNLELIKKGWIEIEGVSSGEELMSIAKSIGNIMQHPSGNYLEIVFPKSGENLTRGSFSQRHGYSSFPLHTDTSFWSRPARYLVLGMLEKSNCDTYALNVNSVINSLSEKALVSAKNSTYLIDTIEEKKYTSVIFKENEIRGFRFDLSCMTPVNKAAKYFHKEFLELLKEQKLESINWTGNKAVVIDNWNVMHGRRSVSKSERKRKLMRIYTE